MSDQRRNLDYGGDQLRERKLRLRTKNLYHFVRWDRVWGFPSLTKVETKAMTFRRIKDLSFSGVVLHVQLLGEGSSGPGRIVPKCPSFLGPN